MFIVNYTFTENEYCPHCAAVHLAPWQEFGWQFDPPSDDVMTLAKARYVESPPPSPTDECAWASEAFTHKPWCPFVLTRNGRWDAYQRGAENAHLALVNFKLAEPIQYCRNAGYWGGCLNREVLIRIYFSVLSLLFDFKTFNDEEVVAYRAAVVWTWDIAGRLAELKEKTRDERHALRELWRAFGRYGHGDVTVQFPRGLLLIDLPAFVDSRPTEAGVLVQLTNDPSEAIKSANDAD